MKATTMRIQEKTTRRVEQMPAPSSEQAADHDHHHDHHDHHDHSHHNHHDHHMIITNNSENCFLRIFSSSIFCSAAADILQLQLEDCHCPL